MSLADSKISFKDYPREKLLIPSIRSRLTSEESEVREAILNNIISTGEPCITHQLSLAGIVDYDGIVENLIAKKVIIFDDATGGIPFAYPVSALPTPHRVTLSDGRSFYSMCALDALGTSYTFEQDVRVKSQCAECGETVFVEISNKHLRHLQPESLYILHTDLSQSDNWASSC